MSLNELLRFLEVQTGEKIPVSYENWRPGDQKVFVGNITKAHNELGWQPTINPGDGVERFYKKVSDNSDLFH